MPRFQITVKPGSSQEKIVKLSGDSIVVYIRAKPHDGEANTALIKLLANHFRIPKTAITIKKGNHSRIKTIEF